MNIYRVNNVLIIASWVKEAIDYYKEKFINQKITSILVKKCSLQEKYWYEFDNNNLLVKLIDKGYEYKEGVLFLNAVKMSLEEILKLDKEYGSKEYPHIVCVCDYNWVI